MSNSLVNDSIKLGFGLMRLPKNEDGTIDVEQTARVADVFLAAGGKHFDTAYAYLGSVRKLFARHLWGVIPARVFPLPRSSMRQPLRQKTNKRLRRSFRRVLSAQAQDTSTFICSMLFPCTGCYYCTPDSPQGIHIPEIFSVMNVYKMYGDLAKARMGYTWRPGGPKASVCIHCGQCEEACPQHLPIISLLEEVVEKLEK